jgi:hypothetical protein
MLTRDIGVTECILDLVDNSVDKAVECQKPDVMAYLISRATRPKVAGRIAIAFTGSRFTIKDDVGGISVREAREEVFRLGYPEANGSRYGLSVYGIGMKRAFFKLGKRIIVESRTSKEAFRVDIDIDEWLRDTRSWDFKFSWIRPVAETQRRATGGTEIVIERLRPEISSRFTQVSFLSTLKTRLASTYALFLKAGLSIRVNGQEVHPNVPVIGADTFDPVRQSFRYGDVDILIIAGLTPATDRIPRGWYVFCNGRMVVEADRTVLTGWGDIFPQFHSKYNRFIGYVYFHSRDVDKLPWTTTKQGVDRDSPVYRAALREMQVHARPIIAFLNRLYPTDVSAEDATLERQVITDATLTTVDKLRKANTTFAISGARQRVRKDISIQYKRPRELVEKLKRHLGKTAWSASRLGEYTFDTVVSQELGRHD